jgi:CDP-diacylglycerol--glycerol-3-phosphate 3-phosphatidyltransferase
LGLRFVLGPALLLCVTGRAGSWRVGGALVAAILSDVFDGVLARRLGVATERIRVTDSWVDTWFCAWVGLAIVLRHWDAVVTFRWLLSLAIATDLGGLTFDYLKYRRFSSYHAYSARAAGFLLFMAAFALLAFNQAGAIIAIALAVAIFSHCERIVLTLLLPRWTHDVAGVWKVAALKGDL